MDSKITGASYSVTKLQMRGEFLGTTLPRPPAGCLRPQLLFVWPNGSKSAIATVLERLDCCPNELNGSNEPQPVQVLGSRQISLADLNDTFKNLWGYDYYFKVHEVKATLIYIQGGDRCVKASMRGITCSSELLPDQTIHIDAGECWGLPIFEQKGEWMESLLYFRERTFDTEEELRLDMSNPAPVNFDGFWEDVFVDG